MKPTKQDLQPAAPKASAVDSPASDSTMSYRAIIGLFNTLKSLNGHDVVVKSEKEDGKVIESVVFQNYHFSGETCLAIAENLTALKPLVESFGHAKEALIKGVDLKDKKKLDALNKELETVLDKQVSVPAFTKIPIEGLFLDENRIQPGTLAAISHLLEKPKK
jgi:hypothetical protein